LQVENRKKKENLSQELMKLEQKEEEGTISLSQVERKVQLHVLLLAMHEEEEMYWFKRAHEKWLHEGDNNTVYFHRIANGRKRKNSILVFTNEGEEIRGDENLIKHATEYYKNLFGPRQGNTVPLDPGLWKDGEKVTVEDNIELVKPFYEEEITSALFQMETNKAAGSDGIPIEFYQKAGISLIKILWICLRNSIVGKWIAVELIMESLPCSQRWKGLTKYSNSDLYVC
jgi:mannosylglycoprotein endo-beta-mannosidase